MRTSSIGLLSALVVSAGLIALPGSSRADTISYAFTSDHCTGGCLTGQVTGGTVTLTDIAGGVSVSVSLSNGNQFVNTGFDASFGFNLVGNPSITYAGITTSCGSPFQVAGTTHKLPGPFIWMVPGFLSTGLTGTGNGGSDPLGSTLSFTITAAGLTIASFQANALGQFFAADIISGTTGLTGGIDASITTSQVPLPPAALLFGTALVGMGILGRRRRKDALAA